MLKKTAAFTGGGFFIVGQI
jgi:hypothetical protein